MFAPRDIIRVNDLQATVSLPSGATLKSQPVLLTVAITYDVKATADTDDLSKSISYSTVSSFIRDSVSSQPFTSLEHLTQHIYAVLFSKFPLLDQISLTVVQPKAFHCQRIAIESTTTKNKLGKVNYSCHHLQCNTIIGVNPGERVEKQPVDFNIYIEEETGDWPNSLDLRFLTGHLYEKISSSSFLTLEALASFVAKHTLQQVAQCWHNHQCFPIVKVKAAKPCALMFAGSAEVEIRRSYNDYPEHFRARANLAPVVAIALGSNVGDSFRNIELALRLLETPLDILCPEDCDATVSLNDMFVTIVDTSFMYQSAPMYVTEQPMFINCACLIETNIPPLTLLRLVKKIESHVGRIPSIRNGPRSIDLDIILYGDTVMDTRTSPDELEGHLVIPHPLMSEREFVLRPLHDMIPHYVHPKLHKTIGTLLHELGVFASDAPLQKVIPFPRYPALETECPSTLTHWTLASDSSFKAAKTFTMATLNATPDSFSDGSLHNTIPSALEYGRRSAKAGTSIVDIGGYSTRPTASFVTVEEETERVVPIIRSLRQDEELRAIPFSIDTFRPEVAKAAILAGANCINDVYGFTGPDSFPLSDEHEENLKAMKKVARELAVPVVLMHSRGDAGQNKEYEDYTYAADGKFIEGVRVELGHKVEKIVKGKGGIRRWFIVVDPGIGFSKPMEGNLELLRNAAAVTADKDIGRGNNAIRNPLAGYPLLIGASRKSFLGNIIGRSTLPNERGWATAAAVACAVQQKTAILRVHDVEEMSDVVAVAEALWHQ